MTTAMETLNCGQCGAPLRVPETAQFVTCNHCRSSLAIRRMDSITLTERVSIAESKLEDVEAQLAELVFRNRVTEEQRRWQRERQLYLTKDESGNLYTPSMAGGYFALAIGVVMSIIIFSYGGGWLGVFPIGVGFFALIATGYAVAEYQRAYSRHRRRVREISQPSAKARSSGEFFQQLEHAPTPEDYLRDLSGKDPLF